MLTSRVMRTSSDVVVLITNHINLIDLNAFYVVEIETFSGESSLEFHGPFLTEGQATERAYKIQSEIMQLVNEAAAPDDTDRVSL